MNLTITTPKFPYGTNPSAVYRFTLDTGHFYIGSSMKLKTRFTSWKTSIKMGKIQSKTLAAAIGEATEIVFEVVEFVEVSKLLEVESKHLAATINDEFSLNRAISGYGVSGLKPLADVITIENVYQKKKPEGFVYKGSKSIHQYDASGNKLNTFVSINDAARLCGLKAKRIRDVLAGVQKTYHGFVWKYA